MESGAVSVAQPELKSSIKTSPGFKIRTKAKAHPLYSDSKENYGPDRESRVKEYHPTYKPGIIPQHIRNCRRTRSLNPHFQRYPKSRHTTKRQLYVRLGVIELSLQNGLGSRYRLVPAPKDSFDFPMKATAKVLYGCGCYQCSVKLRELACLEVVREWEDYKWDVKYFHAFYIDFFRDYDPTDPKASVHERAKYLYKVAVLDRMYECTRLEIGVACQLNDTNFYCIEAIDQDSFRVVPSETNYSQSIYFFAKEIPYSGRLVDKQVDLHDQYFLIWLSPVTEFGKNLMMTECVMRVKYRNVDIGYFHLFEEDPTDPVDAFEASDGQRPIRERYVRFSPVVYALHYYQVRPKRPWFNFMKALGIYQEPEADERIVKYNKLMVTRFHEMEKEFIRLTEISDPAFAYEPRQVQRVGELLEEYLSYIKNRAGGKVQVQYKAETLRLKYLRKWQRNRARLEVISQRFHKYEPPPPKKQRQGHIRLTPHLNMQRRQHRLSGHVIRKPTSLPTPSQAPTGKKK